MRQDDEKCAKCGKPCGYDDNKGYWGGLNLALCSQCRGNLISRFCAFFGIEGVSCNYYGLNIDWHDADTILSRIKKDDAMRISYITADKKLYKRTKTLPVSILEP